MFRWQRPRWQNPRWRRRALLLWCAAIAAPALGAQSSDGAPAAGGTRVPELFPSAHAIVESAHRAAERGQLAAFANRWRAAAAQNDPQASLALGVVAFQQYEYDRADSLLTRVWTPGHGRGTRTLSGSAVQLRAHLDVVRWAKVAYARLLITRGETGRAETLLTSVQPEARVAADSIAMIELLLLRSALAQRSSGTTTLALLDSASLYGIARAPRQHAAQQCRRGALYGAAGRLATMRTFTDSGMVAARQAESQRLEGTCEFVRATTFARLGRTDSLRVSIARAMQLQRNSHDLPALAASLQWQGFYLMSLGRHQLSSQRLAEAWQIATAAHSGNVRAWTALSRAQLSAELNDHRSAIRWLGIADTLMRSLDDLVGQRYAMGMRAHLAFSAGDTTTAWALHARRVAMHERAGDRLGVQAALEEAIGKYASLGLTERAAVALARLDVVAESASTPAYVNSRRITRGEVQLLLGETRAALGTFNDALDAMHPTQHAQRHRVSVLKALALSRLQRMPEAVQAARAGEAALNSWRDALSDSALRTHATRTNHASRPYYTELVSALAVGGYMDDALHLAESQQARRLRDQLAEAGAWAGTSTARSAAEVGSPSIADMQARLGTVGSEFTETALLEFVAGRGAIPSLLLVVTRDSAWSVRVPPMDSLSPLIERTLARLSSGRPLGASSQALGRALLDPVRAPLAAAGVKRVVIVPDDALHLLPFESLLLASGRPAIEEWELSYAPSLTLAMALWEAAATPVKTRGVVAFADPEATGPGVRAPSGAARGPLARLPGARAEVSAIARLVPNTRVHVGRAASEARVKRLSGLRGDVLHIAAHGEVHAWDGRGAALVLAAQTPAQTATQTATQTAAQTAALTAAATGKATRGGEDGLLYGGEVAAMQIRARLVVLSACSTNAGDLVRGEGVSGLTSAFLRAGAHAVVTSAWRVDDRGTARLMQDFYVALSQGASTGAALRTAQRQAMRRGDPPALWAAFRVVGNAGVRPRL